MMNNEVALLMNNEELWYIFFENMILNNIGVADTSIIHYSIFIIHLLYKQQFIELSVGDISYFISYIFFPPPIDESAKKLYDYCEYLYFVSVSDIFFS